MFKYVDYSNNKKSGGSREPPRFQFKDPLFYLSSFQIPFREEPAAKSSGFFLCNEVKMIVYLTIIAVLLASPFGGGASRSELKSADCRWQSYHNIRWPSQSEVGEGLSPLSQSFGLPALPKGEPSSYEDKRSFLVKTKSRLPQITAAFDHIRG